MSAMLFVIAWLHPRVFSKSHSNTLEDFIYVTHCAMEYVAMMRANAAIDLLIARPWRWLAGNGSKLVKLASPMRSRNAVSLHTRSSSPGSCSMAQGYLLHCCVLCDCCVLTSRITKL